MTSQTGTLQNDAALLARIRDGEESALAELYDRHGRTLYSLAYALLGEAHDAEEVVSDTFMRAWNAASTFDPARSSVAGWLVIMTRTRALDRLRTRQRRAQSLDRVAAQDPSGFPLPMGVQEPSPEEATEDSELRSAVQNSLQQLPDAQRRVIELAYFHGLTQSEIAAQLSEPLGTIKTRARAALEKLRHVLQSYAVGAP